MLPGVVITDYDGPLLVLQAVWLDGFSWLRGHLSPREIGELLDICREKEVFLRTDIFEVLLAGMDDDDGNGGSMALNRNDGDLVLA